VILAALAITDIGLHLLLNHLPAGQVSQARRAGLNAAVAFKAQRVWGCDYRKCPGGLK
jgi:hypothetical protein